MSNYSLARVKSSLKHFLLGKASSSVLGVFITLLIVREMTIDDYAIYTVFLGITLLVGSLSSFAIEHTARRYFPELIVKHQYQELASLFIIAILVRLLSLITITVLLYSFRYELISFMSINTTPEIFTGWLIATFIVIVYRFIYSIQQIFMQHKTLKWISVGLNIARLMPILLLYQTQEGLKLLDVIWIEASAHLLFSVLSIIFMIQGLNNIIQDAKFRITFSSLTPRIIKFLKFSSMREFVAIFNGYAINRLIIGKYLTADHVGAFGFAQSLMDFISKYMPSVFLNNMIQPVLMAKYAETGDVKRLNTSLDFIFRLNLIWLLPMLFLCLLVGEDASEYVTKGKYSEVGYYLAGMIVILIFQSHIYFISVIANATEMVSLMLNGAILMALFVVPMVIFVYYYGVWGLIFGRLAGMFARDMYVKHQLKKNSIVCKTDMITNSKLMATMIIPYILCLLLVYLFKIDMSPILLFASYILLVIIFIFIIKPLNKNDLNLLMMLIRKKQSTI